MRVQLRRRPETRKPSPAQAGPPLPGGMYLHGGTAEHRSGGRRCFGIEFVARRAREKSWSKVYSYAALTRRLEGQEITRSACCTNMAPEVSPTASSQWAMLSHAAGALLRHRFRYRDLQHPQEPTLSRGVMNGASWRPAWVSRASAACRSHSAGARPSPGGDDRWPLPRLADFDCREAWKPSDARRRADCR